jgi:hypothetical protein
VTPEEAMEQMLTLMGIRDPFARIAVTDLMRDLDKYGNKMPEPGSEHEKKLMELGAIAWSEIQR